MVASASWSAASQAGGVCGCAVAAPPALLVSGLVAGLGTTNPDDSVRSGATNSSAPALVLAVERPMAKPPSPTTSSTTTAATSSTTIRLEPWKRQRPLSAGASGFGRALLVGPLTRPLIVVDDSSHSGSSLESRLTGAAEPGPSAGSGSVTGRETGATVVAVVARRDQLAGCRSGRRSAAASSSPDTGRIRKWRAASSGQPTVSVAWSTTTSSRPW